MENEGQDLVHPKFAHSCGTNTNLTGRDRIIKKVVSRKDKRNKTQSKKQNEHKFLPVKCDQEIVTSIEDVSKLVQKCGSLNGYVAYKAVSNLRRHLCSKQCLDFDKLLEFKIVDILVSHLFNGETIDVKYDAMATLSIIASSGSQHTSFLIKESVIKALNSLLCDPNPSLVEQSIMALSYFIKALHEATEFFLRSDILAVLNKPLNQHYKSIPALKQISLILINICQNKDYVSPIKFMPSIIPILDVLLAHKDEQILDDVLWSLIHLTDSSADHVSLLISSGIADKVYNFLGLSQKLTINALRVLGNIAASKDEHTQYVLDNGILEHLPPLLTTTNPEIKEPIYFVLSNIAAGTRQQMQTLCTLNILPQIIKDLEEGEYEVKREACCVISNVVHGSTYQEAPPFVESKLLDCMKIILETLDTQMIVLVLEVVLILLRLYSAHNNQEYMCQKTEESGVLDLIENLQISSKKPIRVLAVHIIASYFTEYPEQDDDDKAITVDDDRPDLSDEINKLGL